MSDGILYGNSFSLYTPNCTENLTILLRYSGFEIGTPETKFTIDVTLSYTDVDGNSEEVVVQVSPEQLGATSVGGEVVARLQGDFSGYTEITDYDEYVICVNPKRTM